MEVYRSTGTAYVYRLFFCPFRIFLFNHAVFFSLHSLDLQLLHICTKYSAWGRENYYFCLMAVPILLPMFFVVSTRNLADTWLFEILWGPHVFFLFYSFSPSFWGIFYNMLFGKVKTRNAHSEFRCARRALKIIKEEDNWSQPWPATEKPVGNLLI